MILTSAVEMTVSEEIYAQARKERGALLNAA